MAVSVLRWLLPAALLLASSRLVAAQAALANQPPHLRELEAKYFSYATESLAHAVEARMTLPPGYSPSLEYYVLVRVEVSETGRVENPHIVWQIEHVSEVVNKAILTAVHQLPVLVPGRVAGQPTRTNLTLQVRPGVAAGVANAAQEARQAARNDTTEARTLRTGIIRPRPGETLGQLLHRTLPTTCPDTTTRLLRYAWLPNAAGPQLFFDAQGHGPQAEYGAVVFVLDPLGAGTYHVRALYLGSMGDITTVAALFFADANHDGQKDLLALTECSLREGPTKEYPLGWREAHYQTTAVYYQGRDPAGRPQYETQHLAKLDELSTAAEVRKALAAPPRRGSASAAKRNPRAQTAK